MKITSVLLGIFLYFNALAIKPERGYKAKPENWGLIYKEFKVKTKDNLKINCWFIPNQIITDSSYNDKAIKKVYKYDGITRPTLVICNGDAGNMTYLVSIAFNLCSYGYNICLFDWRGFGESDDWKMDSNYFCYPEFLTDYDAVIDAMIDLPEVDNTKIGVFGFSTGAYLSFAETYKRKEIKCFVGRGLMTEFTPLKEYWDKKRPERQCVIPEEYPKEYYPINISKTLLKPIFLIVGELDEITPRWMSETIYKNLQGPKNLWVVQGAEHGGGNGPEWKNIKDFSLHVITFLRKYLL